jgi:hypothetical protein
LIHFKVKDNMVVLRESSSKLLADVLSIYKIEVKA